MSNILPAANANRAPQENLAPAVQEPFLDAVQRVFLRTITSFLLMTLTAAVIGFTAVALQAYTVAGSALICTLLFLAVFRGPIYAETTVLFNAIYWHLKGYPWWSQITPNLYLGALPLQNFGHLEQLRALGITSVVSINELHEVSVSGLFHEPVTPEAWGRAGIPFRRFAVSDWDAIPRERLQEVVTHIENEIAEGRRVYLHCLKGKGRSVSIAEGYLLHQNLLQQDQAARDAEARMARPPYQQPFREEDAHNQILQHRPQAAPNAKQRSSVRYYSALESHDLRIARRQARRDKG